MRSIGCASLHTKPSIILCMRAMRPSHRSSLKKKSRQSSQSRAMLNSLLVLNLASTTAASAPVAPLQDQMQSSINVCTVMNPDLRLADNLESSLHIFPWSPDSSPSITIRNWQRRCVIGPSTSMILRVIRDVMDSKHYRRLCSEYVHVDGQQLGHHHFSDCHDIALGASTDGFAPFRRCKQTCWPLIFFNYDLPPEICFLIEFILCIGIIPGPKKPHDFDSFFWPAMAELLLLAVGVPAFDASTGEVFLLRAYLILFFRDMPCNINGHALQGPQWLLPLLGL